MVGISPRLWYQWRRGATIDCSQPRLFMKVFACVFKGEETTLLDLISNMYYYCITIVCVYVCGGCVTVCIEKYCETFVTETDI